MKRNQKIFILVFIFLLCCFHFPIKSEVEAEIDEKTVFIQHVDNYNVQVQETMVMTGESGDELTLVESDSPYFTLNSNQSLSYTITEQENQIVVLRYTARKIEASTFMSMFFNTTYTYTGFDEAEYGGNLAYFDKVADESIRGAVGISFKNPSLVNKLYTFELDLPLGNKIALEEAMDVRIFAFNDAPQVMPTEVFNPDFTQGSVDLATNGVQIEYWISIDHGETYLAYESLTEQQATQATNVVGRVFFSQELDSRVPRLYIISHLPIHLQSNNLSEDELQGVSPIGGWKYRTPQYRNQVSLDTEIFLKNPTISGVVKSNQKQDWDSAMALANQKVQLIEITADNQENVLAETLTAADGSYYFHDEIDSFDCIKIKVLDRQGFESYFYYVDPTELQANYLETNYIAVGNLPEVVVSTENTDYNWYETPEKKSFAKASQSLDFLLVSSKLVVNTYTVTYTDGVENQEIFRDLVYEVNENDVTPAFEGSLFRNGYEFSGWDPEISETAMRNQIYTAQWKKVESFPTDPNKPDPKPEVEIEKPDIKPQAPTNKEKQTINKPNTIAPQAGDNTNRLLFYAIGLLGIGVTVACIMILKADGRVGS